MKFRIAVLACATLVSGCETFSKSELAALDAYGVNAQPTLPANPNSFIRDERSEKSKKERHPLAVWMWECDYYVYNLPDLGGASDRVARLERDLVQAFGPQTEQAVLRKYGIFHNNAYSWFSQHSGGIVPGLMGAAAMGPGEGFRPKCAQEKMAGGWFDKADLTNENAPITVDIDLNYRGRDYKATAAVSPPFDQDMSELGDMDQPGIVALIQEAEAKANARLIEAIKLSISASEPAS